MRISEYQWGKLTSSDKKLIIAYLRYLHMKCILRKPPICFAIRTSLLSFALLFIFPLEPMTIPAVFGVALSTSLVISAF